MTPVAAWPPAPLGTGLRRYDGVVWSPDQVQNDGRMAVWGYFHSNEIGEAHDDI